MTILVGAFLVANGALDMALAARSRGTIDTAIAVAGIVLGVLTLAGVGV